MIKHLQTKPFYIWSHFVWYTKRWRKSNKKEFSLKRMTGRAPRGKKENSQSMWFPPVVAQAYRILSPQITQIFSSNFVLKYSSQPLVEYVCFSSFLRFYSPLCCTSSVPRGYKKDGNRATLFSFVWNLVSFIREGRKKSKGRK